MQLNIVMVLWFVGQEFVHHSTHTNPEFATQAVTDLLENGITEGGTMPRFPVSVRIDRKLDQRQRSRSFDDKGLNALGQTLADWFKDRDVE